LSVADFPAPRQAAAAGLGAGDRSAFA